MARRNFQFTSESVSEGHPDKVCDRISDEVVDLFYRESEASGVDPRHVRVACETMCTTNRVIIANATELKTRPDVIARYMQGYRDSMHWIYSTPEGLKAYAAFAKLSEATARRALAEFLPTTAVDPDRISGIEEVMADAVSFKFIPAPLTQAQLGELIRIPERRP